MNPRLAPMNTQARVLRLEAGQAFRSPSRTAGPAVLTEGELLVQEPARWLGERVVVSAPVRLVAPAVVPAGSRWTIVAARASTLTVSETAPFVAQALGTVSAWIRSVPRRTRGALRHVAG